MFCTMMPLTSSTFARTRWILLISPGLFMQYSMWYLRRGLKVRSNALALALLAFSPCFDLNSVCICAQGWRSGATGWVASAGLGGRVRTMSSS